MQFTIKYKSDDIASKAVAESSLNTLREAAKKLASEFGGAPPVEIDATTKLKDKGSYVSLTVECEQ